MVLGLGLSDNSKGIFNVVASSSLCKMLALLTYNRGDADICTAGLSVVLERTFYIDYTVSVRKNDIGITVLASNAVTLNIWVFADVFLGTLWMGILGAAVTLMVMFVLVRIIIGRKFHMDDDPEIFDIWNAFALVTMVFMQRDYFFQKLSLTSK